MDRRKYTGRATRFIGRTKHDGPGTGHQRFTTGNGYLAGGEVIGKALLYRRIKQGQYLFLLTIYRLPFLFPDQAPQLKGKFLSVQAKYKSTLKFVKLLGKFHFQFGTGRMKDRLVSLAGRKWLIHGMTKRFADTLENVLFGGGDFHGANIDQDFRIMGFEDYLGLLRIGDKNRF